MESANVLLEKWLKQLINYRIVSNKFFCRSTLLQLFVCRIISREILASDWLIGICSTTTECPSSPTPIRPCWMQVMTPTTCFTPGSAVAMTMRGSRRSSSLSPITTCRQPDCCWRTEPWPTKTQSNVCRYLCVCVCVCVCVCACVCVLVTVSILRHDWKLLSSRHDVKPSMRQRDWIYCYYDFTDENTRV